jgi:hypothetical protein
MKCAVDGQEMAPIFSATILGKYRGEYFKCPECRLIQVASPHWLSESYSSAIAATDVGLVGRNLANMRLLEPILYRLAADDATIHDVGGGYGLLCRGLRDSGFDCFTSDIYCENLFAKGFEPGLGFKAEVLLAFEVMEHIGDPREFVQTKFAESGAEMMVFSTLTYDEESFPELGWWYYAFETGQHISIYHEDSLRALARRLGMHHFSLSSTMHLITRRPLDYADKLLLSRRSRLLGRLYEAWVRRVRRRRSLTGSDYEAAKARLQRGFDGRG